MQRIYDCFLFDGEFDQLEWRIRELQGVVDYFLIVEAAQTFQGKPKKPFIVSSPETMNHLAGIVGYGALCRHMISDASVFRTPMDREVWQRNQIVPGLLNMSRPPQPNDVIMVSDVDEIPSAAAVVTAQPWLMGTSALAFSQRLFHGWINMACQTEPWWSGTHATLMRNFTSGQLTPQRLRVNNQVPTIRQGGWHFSFLGGAEAMAKKLSRWSHWEWDTPPYNTMENLEAALRDGRDWDFKRNMRYEFVEVDESYPQWIYEHRNDPEIARHIHAPVPVE